MLFMRTNLAIWYIHVPAPTGCRKRKVKQPNGKVGRGSSASLSFLDSLWFELE
jgi:hypothetical protein